MMQREVGDSGFPIWLLGDSNPANWEGELDSPFDPRHPARHNVWTSVADVIQDRAFRVDRRRVEMTRLYIRNAIEKASEKPRAKDVSWPNDINAEVSIFHEIVNHSKSLCIILSFGAFAYEFGRRALGQEPRNYGYWGARTLGQAFRDAVANFQPESRNLIPLLHISISGGKFLQSHRIFCDTNTANYFDYVGTSLGELLIQHRSNIPIWIK